MKYFMMVLVGILMTPVSAVIGAGVLCIFLPLLPSVFFRHFVPWLIALAWAAPGTIIVFPILKLVYERNPHFRPAVFRRSCAVSGAAVAILPLALLNFSHENKTFLWWLMLPEFATFSLSGFVSGYLTSVLYLRVADKLKPAS